MTIDIRTRITTLAHAAGIDGDIVVKVMGWKLEDVAAANVEKLRARYPNGFTPEDSVARRDEAQARAEGRALVCRGCAGTGSLDGVLCGDCHGAGVVS